MRTPRTIATRTAVALVAAWAARAGADGGAVAGRVDVTPAKYLGETVVYLEAVPGSHPPRTHQMDQQGLKFVPHLLVITQGDTVKFLNHDGVAHNVYSPDGDAYNLGSFKGGEARTQTFASPGAYAQLCSIHPEMLGYVFVGQNPYAAAVDDKGKYEIHDIPPGTYQLKVWNSHLPGTSRSVTVAAGAAAAVDLAIHR
jgi:plastocyanin